MRAYERNFCTVLCTDLGDFLIITGSVKRKFVEDSRHLVEIEQLAHNQHDELSVIGSGIVELPSRAT